MALEIRNAPGRPGYAHLVFDGAINADPLKITVYNLLKREYLGHSIVKANWTPARSHFFKAPFVERNQERSIFLIGPEVTTFIPDETTVELASEDFKIRERAVWNGILLDFHWKGPDPQPDTFKSEVEERQREEKPHREVVRSEVERRREEERRRAEEGKLAEAAMRERAHLEDQALLAGQKPASAKRGDGAPRSFKKLFLIVVAFIVTGGLVWGAQNRDILCDTFGVLCTEETLAFRKAEACAKPLACAAKSSCFVDYRRNHYQSRYNTEIDRILNSCRDLEREAYDRAEQCARPLACDANSCISEYRRDYPSGRFKAQIDRIATEKGAPCRDFDREAYQKAEQCSRSLTCGANTCLAEYRRDFANGRYKMEIDRIATEKGAPCRDLDREAYQKAEQCSRSLTCGANTCLAEYRRDFANGRYKMEIDRIATEKGAPCRDLDREAYQKAEQCSRSLTCGANTCLAEYRRDFANGRYKMEIDRIATEKGAPCRDLDREVYQRAEQCARPLTCGANTCLDEYRLDFPNGRYKMEIDRIATEKGAPCRDLDREAYQRAEQCARSLTCGANSCLMEYRRDFTNGRYKAEVDRIGAEKGRSCPIIPSIDIIPSFNPRPPNQDAGINCAQLQNPEPIEQMICADADLARANSELQRAWERLPLNRRQSLRPEQRDWIVRRDADCNVPRGGDWDQMTLRRLKRCVIDKTRTRSNELR